MASSDKMTALKTATHNLLDQLKDAASVNGDVYVSIIPFVKDVNVGSASYTAELGEVGRQRHQGPRPVEQVERHLQRRLLRLLLHGPVELPEPRLHLDAGEPHQRWNGCIMDRDQSYDTLTTAPTTIRHRRRSSRPSSTAPAPPR